MTGDITTTAVQETMSASLRVVIYTLLAALLAQPPASDRLAQLEDLNILPGIPSVLGQAIAELKMASRRTSAEAAVKEYDILFVGLGRGDIVPYASWYEEGVLRGTPRARLRQDLVRMAIHRRGETCEPEDHVAALCETMVLLFAKSRILAEIGRKDLAITTGERALKVGKEANVNPNSIAFLERLIIGWKSE